MKSCIGQDLESNELMDGRDDWDDYVRNNHILSGDVPVPGECGFHSHEQRHHMSQHSDVNVT
jgi:hypothetical protein